MNQHCHRLVFNRARGMRMAVAETARCSTGDPGQSGRAGADSVLWARVPALRVAVWLACGLVGPGLWPSASAQISGDRSAPGAQRPTVLAAPNGVPVVDIQTPSAVGVSRNRYSRFDVGAPGAIFNNSRTAVQSQLGGWLQGNPWLARGTARIILNEVNSSSPSHLQGVIEVAGQRAQVVIANPAGITCDGCGFLNAPRATLTTGVPRLAGGDLAGWQVDKGEVQVVGRGMDGRQASYTDIIARAVRIDAELLAQRLDVIAGVREVTVDAEGAPTAAGAPAGASPPRAAPAAVAIDVSSLGGMYAGRITLVGYGSGVGVRNAGAIGATAGDILLTADGRLENAGTLRAEGAIRLDAAGGAVNAGTVFARGDVRLSTDGNIHHSGVLAAGGDLHLSALGASSALRTTAGSLMAAGAQDDGRVGGTGRIHVTATRALQAHGKHLSGTAIQMRAGDLDLSGSKSRAAGAALHADGGSLLLTSADVVAAQAVTASASRHLDTADALIAAGQLRLEAATLSNRAGWLQADGQAELNARVGLNNNGGTVVAGQLSLQAGGEVTNAGGHLASAGHLQVTATSLDNRGGDIQSHDDLQLSVQQALDNTAGLVRTDRALAVQAQSVVNDATQDAGQGLEGQSVLLGVHRISNRGGAIRASASLSIRSGGRIDNSEGVLSSRGGLRVQDAAGAPRRLVVENRRGVLVADGDLTLEASRLGGDGRILSGGSLALRLSEAYHHTGTLQAARDATLEADSAITNEGDLRAGGVLRLRLQSLDQRVAGTLQGQAVQIETTGADGLINRGLINGQHVGIDTAFLRNLGGGRLYGDRVALRADALVNAAEGGIAPVIAARERLDLGVRTLENREHGLIFSAGDMAIGGDLDGNRQATHPAQSVRNISATIEARKALRLDAHEVLNADAHFSTETVDLPAQQVTEVAGQGSPHRYAPDAPGVYVFNSESDHLQTPEGTFETWYRYQYTRRVSETRVATADPARILSGADLHITADQGVNDTSQILAGGRLTVEGGTLVNTEPGATRITRDQGEVFKFSREQHKGRDATRVEQWGYQPPERVESISLGVAVSRSQAHGAGSGTVLPAVAIASTPAPASQTGSAAVPPPSGVEARIGRIDKRVPASSLYRAVPDPASRVLVETDPRFADYRTWLGSDYLMKALALDPATLQKRLGNGFYEQQLVREQVAQLTGRRLLADYDTDDEQFRALMDNGATFARAHRLRPGLALSPEQVAQLTSDIVWLVEQEVTLPDGRVTRALVPQVYARVREGDLTDSGALLAGRDVELRLSGDLVNGGSIQGTEALEAQVRNLRNLGGRLAGGSVYLRAREDIDHLGGSIRADQHLALEAGRDLRVASTTASTVSPQGSRTAIDRLATLYAASPEGILTARAGRDIQITAAQVRSAGELAVQSGRHLELGTLTLSSTESIGRDAANHRHESQRTQAGSTLAAGGDLTLVAGEDLTARAASVTSDGGTLRAAAGRDVLVAAGESQVQVTDAHRATRRSTFSRTTRETLKELDQTTTQASTFSGLHTEVTAGRDIQVTGSQVVSEAHTALEAGRDIHVRAANESRATTDSHRVSRSGLFGSGGAGVTMGRQSQSSRDEAVITSAARSTVGSVSGDVHVEAGTAYRQAGSDVLAPQGHVDIRAQAVEVTEARETQRIDRATESRQSGLTVSLSNPVATAVQTVRRVQEAARESKDTRMKALAALAGGLAVYEAGSAVADDPARAGGVTIHFSLGSSRSTSSSSKVSDNASGSRVLAGGDVRLQASGTGADLLVQGSRVEAGGSLDLRATGQVVLRAALDESRYRSEDRSAGAAVGMSVGLGKTGAGFDVTASASQGRGDAQGEERSWVTARAHAGKEARIESGGDTLLQGATVQAPRVTAGVGGDLHVESLQDAASYASRQRTAGLGVSYGTSGLRGSASTGRSDADLHYTSVTEPSGVLAGERGFDIAVRGHTELKGGVLAGAQEAEKPGQNRLVTGTLRTSDLENAASAEARSSGVTLSSDMFTRGKYGAAKALVGNTMLNASQSLQAADETRAAVSPGTVVITDEAAQKALTGQDTRQTLASLLRDTQAAHAKAVRLDLDPLQKAVNAQRVIKQETFRAIMVFTDEAYRSRFEVKPKLFKVECRKGANCVKDPNQVIYRPATAQEVAQAPAGAVLAVNGILNNEQRGAELAYQNAESNQRGVPSTSPEDSGKPGVAYLMHIAPSKHTLSELMGVAYEKITAESDYGLANFLGYTSGQQLYADLLRSRESQKTVSLGHSRGTLVQAAAFTILANTQDESGKKYLNPSLIVRGVGGAVPVDDYTKKAAVLLGEKGDVNQISFVYFSNDPVSTASVAGNNPGVWTLSDLWQVWKTSNSMHSCYGTGANGCTQVEAPLPGGPQGTPDGNAKLIKFVGGQKVKQETFGQMKFQDGGVER
jgi:filamentous hemagglutinin